MTKIDPKTPYGINFDTKDAPPLIKYVRVKLEEGFMRQEDSVRVDLCNHPLYPALVKYVKSNPIPK